MPEEIIDEKCGTLEILGFQSTKDWECESPFIDGKNTNRIHLITSKDQLAALVKTSMPGRCETSLFFDAFKTDFTKHSLLVGYATIFQSFGFVSSTLEKNCDNNTLLYSVKLSSCGAFGEVSDYLFAVKFSKTGTKPIVKANIVATRCPPGSDQIINF